MTEMMKYVMEEECNEQYIDALLFLPVIVSSFPLPSVDITNTSFKSGIRVAEYDFHITPETVPLSIKSANAETGLGVTSRP